MYFPMEKNKREGLYLIKRCELPVERMSFGSFGYKSYVFSSSKFSSPICGSQFPKFERRKETLYQTN